MVARDFYEYEQFFYRQEIWRQLRLKKRSAWQYANNSENNIQLSRLGTLNALSTYTPTTYTEQWQKIV